MNKTKLIIIFLTGVLITLLLVVILTRRNNVQNIVPPVPVFSATPRSLQPNAQQTVTTQQEALQAEANYAKERQKILTQKPWILKMPIKNEAYFLSYDTGDDVFNVTIYIYSGYPKDYQITRAKLRVNKDLSDIGVDATKVKINYTEKAI